MALNLGTLYGTIELRDKLTGQLDGAINSVRMFERGLGSSLGAFQGINAAMAVTGAALTGVTALMVGLAVSGVKAFASFEKQMKLVQSVTGATAEQFKILQANAMELGTTTMFSSEQAAQGMLELARAGFDTNAIMATMPNVLNLATGAQMDLARATEITVNVMHGYNLAASESMRIADVLTVTANRTATDVNDLGFAFKYAGPVAASAGLDFEETAAALGLLANAGFKGTMGGTALRGVITRLLAPTKEASGIMKQLGIDVVDATGKLLPLDQVMQQFAPHVENTAAMMQIFGQRAGPGMIALVNQGVPALQKLRQELEMSAGAAAGVAAVQMEALSNKWMLLKNTANALAIELGAQLAPALTAVVQAGIDVLKWAQSLPDSVKMTALAVGALLAVLGPLLLALSAWQFVLPLVSGGMVMLLGGLKSVVALLPMFVSGLITAGSAIATGLSAGLASLPGLAAGFIAAFRAMGAAVVAFSSTMLLNLRAAITAIPALLAGVPAALSGMLTSLSAGFVTVGASISGMFMAAIAAAKAALITLATTIGSLLVILASLAAAFAVGYAIGSIIRAGLEFLGLAKYVDQAAQAVVNFWMGVNKDTEKGIDVTKTWTASQKAAYDGMVKRSNEAIEASKKLTTATTDTGSSIHKSNEEIRAMVREQMKAKAEAEKLEKATKLLGREVEDLTTAEIALAEAAKNDELEKQAEKMKKAAEAASEYAKRLDFARQTLEMYAQAEGGILNQRQGASGQELFESQAVGQMERNASGGMFGAASGKQDANAELWEKLISNKEAENAQKRLIAGAKELLKAGTITREQYNKLVPDAEKIADATFNWGVFMQGVAMVAQTIGGKFGDLLKVIGNIGESFKDFGKMDLAGKIGAIGGAVGQIGGMIGGGAGAALQGAGGGAMMGAQIGSLMGPVGTVAGAAVGAIGGLIAGILGNAKKKAAELKKKQDEAVDAFGKMFDDWKNAKKELAQKGAEGINQMMGSMVDPETGELNLQFTSAANAATYLGASFEMLRRSGMSISEAFELLKPSIDAMSQVDPEQLKGTAAEPLVQMMEAAGANEALLNFTAGLGTTANALSGFGLLTQDLATKMSLDLGGAIQSMIDAGTPYNIALGLNAQALFEMQQAALNSGVTLDAHTQKLIDDAQAAGLFENLQDPMDRLVEIQNAMLVATGELVKLFGGAVPAAVQKMIDEFNNTKVNVNVNVNTNAPNTTTTTTGPPPEVNTEGYATGTKGIMDFGEGYATVLHNEEGVMTRDTWESLGQAQTDALRAEVVGLRADLIRILPSAIGRSIRDSNMQTV